MFLLRHFDLAQLIDSLSLFFELSDLSLFLIKLELQRVSFGLLSCSGRFDVNQFVSAGFHNALQLLVLAQLLLYRDLLLCKMRLIGHI